ncbi:GIY-YIG nuclease family protein [Candidatus Gottesmanbacteria bacterium]|nr:GIY-YIG nuclease family protein [Candidatus Gottesmanbacteria bacterium]MBI3559755.1 GIY-YIG nuclease family protein [Candidatus Gottesmanbacteria bacterium]
MNYFVYMLSNKRNGTLYIGSTNNLVKRMYEHKQKLIDGFTKRYGVDQLMYYEVCETALVMVTRERQLKKWNRLWKLKLIEGTNPDWQDLYPTII